MHSTRIHRLLFIYVLILCFAAPEHVVLSAAPFTITSATDAVDADLNDGLCATANGQCTLRAAIQQANVLSTVTTIIVPTGTYTLTIQPVGGEANDPENGDLDVSHSLAIVGAGAGSTIIDGGQIDRILEIYHDSTVQLTGVTLQHGKARFAAGGAISNGGSLFLNDTTIRNNTTNAFGGGIANSGTLTITQSSITENVALFTGGGGIYNFGGQLTITQSTLSNNQGTGLRNETARPVRVTDSTINGNTGFQGGGIDNTGYSGTITLTNSTVSNNAATGDSGGGIANTSTDTVMLINSTLADNAAVTSGGNLYNTDTGQVHLVNTIVANSPSGANCAGPITSDGFNLDSGATCGFAAPGDLSNTDPQLGPLRKNSGATVTHALAATSPAIDAGTNIGCPAYDQRGIVRPQGPRCDIGAYEVTQGKLKFYLPLSAAGAPAAML